MPTLDETRDLVRRVFDGQFDKGGRPYAEHCERVEQLLGPEATEDERHAALLHDMVEDVPGGLDLLNELGYSRRTRALVDALSRSHVEPYDKYVQGIANSGDLGLILIKLADNIDNSDPERLARLKPSERDRLSRKYAKARAILHAAREANGPPLDS